MKVQRRQYGRVDSNESEELIDGKDSSTVSGKEESIACNRFGVWDRRRWVNVVMGAFFSFAASLQTNDPDWYLWIVVYTVPALLVVSLVIKPSLIGNPFWRIACSTTFALTIGFSIYLLVEFGRVLNPKIGFNPLLYEEGKELLGVLIVIFWLHVCREASFTVDGS